MASDNRKINVTITADTSDLNNELKKSGQRLNEFGEKVGGLGMRLSGFLTLPILAIGKWALQNEELKKSFEPISTELAKVNNELAEALIPLVRETVPAIIDMVQALGQVVTWFGNLDSGTQKTILTFVGFVAAVGPVLAIIGQVVQTVGIAQTVFAGLGPMMTAATTGMTAFGAATGIALGPVVALAAAVGVLIALWNSPAADNTKKFLAMAAGGLAGAFGGEQAGIDAFYGASKTMGIPGFANGFSGVVGGSGGTDSKLVQFMGTPGEPVLVGRSAAQGGGGGLTVIVQAKNLIGDADGIQRAITPALDKWARAKGVI
jgi:hypothetical protein